MGDLSVSEMNKIGERDLDRRAKERVSARRGDQIRVGMDQARGMGTREVEK